MYQIKGYEFKEKIHMGSNSIIYKVTRISDKKDLVLKILPEEIPTQKDIARFNLEFKISSEFKSKLFINMYSIEKHNKTIIIIMDYFNAPSLNQYIQKNSIATGEFLEIAIQLVKGISEIHNRNIIHKDINPSNILWNSKTKELKIIDFGISSYLASEIQSELGPRGLEGTFSYISPEQTGRMNRCIDYRSDYYSLGVTLYELATGSRPFNSDDFMELIHYHIAKIPKSPHEINPEIPQLISDIIYKLISKNAEDRYQSTFSLLKDLKRAYDNFLKYNTIQNFKIAENDVSEKFEISQKLYGRNKELLTLKTAFDMVIETKYPEMILITGYSGIGKTSLVKEFQKTIFNKNNYFISGKFDQLSKNIPYLPIVQAFQELTKLILTECDSQIKYWKGTILKSVENMGKVITNVIPGIEDIIGLQPDIPELEPFNEQQRFKQVFQKFIKSIVKDNHTLIFFIDDLQWADNSSLELIKTLMTGNDMKNIYFIGSYRENEVDESHPLMLTLKEIFRLKTNISTVKLSPLNIESISKLLSDTLKCSNSEVQNLAVACLRKTHGNPFFIGQFLKLLYSKKHITFNKQSGKWDWDISLINNSNITDNVVEFISDKIKTLTIEVQEILKYASCIGNQFDINTLSIISGLSKKEILKSIWILLKNNYLIPLENNYKYLIDENIDINVSYRFLHDRIQQAAYKLIPEKSKKKFHYLAGTLLLNNSNEIENKLFEIINHINYALELIKNSEKELICKLNLKAGIKAKNSNAYDISYKYLLIAKKLLKDDFWINQYKIALDIHIELLKVSYMDNKIDEMNLYFDEINRNATDIYSVITCYEIKASYYMSVNERFASLNTALSALKLLGLKVPNKITKSHIVKNLIFVKLILKNKTSDQLINMKSIEDDKVTATMHLLIKSTLNAYQIDKNTLLWLLLESIKLTIKYGNSKSSVVAYMGYALIMFSLKNIIEGIKYTDISLEVYKKYGAGDLEAFYAFTLNIFLLHHTKSINKMLKDIDQIYIKGIEFGDYDIVSLAAAYTSRYYFYAGYNIDYIEEKSISMTDVLEKIGYAPHIITNNLTKQIIYNLKYKTDSPIILTGKFMDENATLEILKKSLSFTNMFALYNFKLMLCCIFNDYTDVALYIKKSNKYINAVTASIGIPVFKFYESLAYIQQIYTQSRSMKKKYLKSINKNQKVLKLYSKYSPSNHLHKYYLIEAELHGFLGNGNLSIEYYAKATETASKNEYLSEESISYECAGKYFLRNKNKFTAYTYLSKARELYNIWGASEKVKQLEKKYPMIKDFIGKTKINFESQTLHTSAFKNSEIVDLTSVIKASQAISSEMEYKKLIEKLMKIISENTCVQKVTILRVENHKIIFEADYSLNSEIVNFISPENLSEIIPLTIIKYVERSKETLVYNNKINDTFINDKYINKVNPKSILCMPIQKKGIIYNILYIENKITADVFTPDRMKVLKLLTSQMLISIENSRLYQQAVTDGLTNTYNREFFNNFIIKKVFEAKRYNKSFTLLMLDIDFFKKVNDNYGHQTGDLILQQTVQIMCNLLRKSDLLARYGGEEFVILLIETDIHGAIIVAEKIRTTIEKKSFNILLDKQNPIKITVSIGVAEYDKNDDRISIIEKADKNLYAAKNNGRNQIFTNEIKYNQKIN
ncbi:MAG: diguanylate cyclase [Clostridiales bacterium]